MTKKRPKKTGLTMIEMSCVMRPLQFCT